MSNQFLKHVIEKLKAAGFDNEESPFIGCSISEIERLEKHYKINLPTSYKEFLLAMGKDCGNFLLGYDYSFDTLFTLTEESQSLVAEEPSCSFRLSPNDFVFVASQGSQFLFFDTKSGDNPPVQYFLEGADEPKQKYDSFSHCLEQLAKAQIEAARERAKA
jgi:hypothetical protein